MQLKKTIAIYSALIVTLLGITSELHASENSQSKYLQQAIEHRNRGELSAAVIEFKNALQEDPYNTEARLLLGMTYLPMNQGESAEKELRRALKLGAERPTVILPLGEALLIQGKTAELLDEILPNENFQAEINAQVSALRADAYLSQGQLEKAATAARLALRQPPRLTLALLVEGRIALINNQLAIAEARVTEILKNQPDNPKAWSLAGDLNQQQGELEKAEAAYSRVIDNSTDSSLVQLKRALLRIEQKNFSGASSDILILRNLLGDHPDLNYAAGLLAFRQQNSASAETLFSRVVEQQPNNLSALFYLGASSYLQGNLVQAEHYLSRSLTSQPNALRTATLLGMTRLQAGDHPGAEAVLRPLLSNHSDDPLVLKTLGKALIAQEKLEEGNRLLANAVILNPDSASDRIDMALGLLHSGETAAGIEALQTAIKLTPQKSKADILLIREYLQAGEFNTVLVLANNLLSQWPDSPAPYTLMGMAYIGKGEIDNAHRAFEQAIRIQPGEPSAASNLATLELHAGNTDKARSYYQQVLEQQPEHLPTLLMLSRMESLLGNEREAHIWLDKAINAEPEALQPRLILAKVKLTQGRALSALMTLQPMQELYAANPALLALLGEIQIAAQQAPKAVETVQRWAQLQPASAEAHYLLARAYAADKNSQGLKEALFRGLELQPTHPSAAPVMALFLGLSSQEQEAYQRLSELQQILPGSTLVKDLEGRLAMQYRHPQQAVMIFEQLLKSSPKDRQWTLLLAQAQRQAGAIEEHLATLTHWLASYPQDASTQFMLAASYLDLERNTQAMASFTRLIELDPENVIGLNNLAWLLKDTEPQRALKLAEQAQRLSPKNATITDTLSVIRQIVYQTN